MSNLTEEILLNATFGLITKVPLTQLNEILDELYTCFKEFLVYEESNPKLIDAILRDP